MQEGSVTAGGTSYQLKPPFFVLATQNPIEQEGTYPLPEAQLDRFLFKLSRALPQPEEVNEVGEPDDPAARPRPWPRCWTARQILACGNPRSAKSSSPTRYAITPSAWCWRRMRADRSLLRPPISTCDGAQPARRRR